MSRPQTPEVSSSRVTAGVVVAVSVTTLVLGVVVGFFLGRITERDIATQSSAPLTSPSTTTSRPPGNTIPPQPPADPDAPPSTDLEPESIGGVEDPIPPGQAYVLGLYEIEVRSTDRDAADALRAFDADNPAPPDGQRHVLVEIAVRFNDATGLGNPAAIPFFVSDGVSEWNDVEAQCGLVPDSILDTGLLEAGDEAVGNVCFTVPDDAIADLLFGTEGFDGPLYFALPN